MGEEGGLVEGKLSEACRLCDRLERVPVVAVINAVARIWMSLAGYVGEKHARASVYFQGSAGPHSMFCLIPWLGSPFSVFDASHFVPLLSLCCHLPDTA